MINQVMWVLISIGSSGPVELGPYQKEKDCEAVRSAIIKMEDAYEAYSKCVKISW